MTTDAFAGLADAERWLAWREEQRGGKPSKIPYSAKGGRAKADDPATWAPRSAAEAAAKQLLNGSDRGGVGIVLGDCGGDLYLCGIDLDACLDDGLVADWAAEIVGAVDSYCEVSPSGAGVKLFFYVAASDVRPFLHKLGADPAGWGVQRAPVVDGVLLDSRNHGPKIELYCSHRYFAATGRHWGQSPNRIALLDGAELDALAALIPGKPKGPNADDFVNQAGHDTSRSAKAFRKGAELRRQGCTFEEMCAALARDPDPDIREWVHDKGEPANRRGLRRIWERSIPAGEGVALADFWAYMPQHSYIYAPTREPWPKASVNARLPAVEIGRDAEGEPVRIPAAAWIDRHQPVEQMTWAPGEAMVIADRLISDGGWIERRGVHVFNLYRPPSLPHGNPAQAGRWRAHLERIYPDDAAHIMRWLAQRVQRPAEKINHALVLGGLQGIGKDTLLEPVKRAVGPWNWAEPSPVQVMGRFNGFAKAVIVRISEAHDLGDVDRYALYEHLKVYAAAPPDVLRVDEKNLREHAVLNCCGLIVTTNHKIDGIYLPADDRRHYVAWSSLAKEDFDDAYWDDLWGWYDSGGDSGVAAYLAEFDLAGFNPKAPPPKTEAFWTIVNAGRSPEDAEMADCLDLLANPDAVTVAMVLRAAETLFPPPPPAAPGMPFPKADSFADWLKDRKNRRAIPHRFEACGYAPVRNPDAPAEGRWKIAGRQIVIYAKTILSRRDQIAAARTLVR